jgi:hypothetical protein
MVETVAAADVAHFAAHGWLRTGPIVDPARLAGWVDEVARWPDEAGDWLHHREQTDAGPQLCRSENFVPYHEPLRALLTDGPLVAAASALLGEPAVLYKEKINYKPPGGAGYAPHQDAPAYPFVASHVSCMIAVDDAGPGNGCLEVVSGHHQAVLPMDSAGCIRADVASGLTWEPVQVRAGEVLWFHSRTPHRSGPNLGSTPRRALYPTYNAAAEGDLRADYYAAKREALAGSSAVSLIGDFQGRPVP